MFCRNCGNSVSDDYGLCPFCGTPLNIKQDHTQHRASEQQLQEEYSMDYSRYNTNTASPDYSLDTIVSELIRTRKTVRFLIVFIIVCICVVGLFYFIYSKNVASVGLPARLLMVYLEEDIEAEDRSDTIQVENALKNGGAIRIQSTNDGYLYSLNRSEVEKYAAVDSNGSYYIIGTVLNYIASNGWTLVQAPTTGLSNTYFFVR